MIIELKGRTFGDWEVLQMAGRSADRSVMWICRCVCGTVRPVTSRNLLHGGSLGCGCTKKGLRLRPYEALYNTIRRMNKDKEIELSYEEFVQFTTVTKCHYCDTAVHWAEFDIMRNGSNYNLDRKDNCQGYYNRNCVVCCARCNRLKSNQFTYEQMIQIGALINSWRNNGNN
jgi:hypothetical protein